MDERAADAEVVSIDDLLERVRREGPVLRFNNDVVGIFDPALAVRIDKANTDQHTVPDSLIDFLGLRSGRDPVAWREVRALLSEQWQLVGEKEGDAESLRELPRTRIGDE